MKLDHRPYIEDYDYRDRVHAGLIHQVITVAPAKAELSVLHDQEPNRCCVLEPWRFTFARLEQALESAGFPRGSVVVVVGDPDDPDAAYRDA